MGRSDGKRISPSRGAALVAALLIGGAAPGQGLYGPEIPQPVVAPVASEPVQIPTETKTPEAAPVKAAPTGREALPLGPAPKAVRASGGDEAAAPARGSSAMMRTMGGLLIVLGLIFILRWAIVRGARRGGGLIGQFGAGGRAPAGLLEVLGRYPVGRGQTLSLVRLDRRVLLLSQSSGGFTTLAEVTSPDDVASILMKAADDEGVSMTHRFQKLLKGMERDPSLVQEVETIEVGAPRARFARAIKRDFAPAERAGSVASLRRRLSAMREGGA